VRIVTELFSGPEMAAVLTPQWNGGLYYAVQSRKAVTPQEQASTASIGLLYLSAWKSERAAREFAAMYGRELSQKYSNVKRDPAAETAADERVYNGSEGPVLIVRQGTQVFISESFDLDMARKLQFLFFGAQQNGDNQQAARLTAPPDELNARMTRLIASCGLMKASLRR
jgi:hypothetical protein